MLFKNLLNSILPTIVINGIKRIFEVKSFFSKYKGVNGLDKLLEKYLNYDAGYFIELGANDGRSQSNTHYFEKYRNWTGVIIEPAPNNFLKCIRNRNVRTKKFCNACVSFDYKEKFVEFIYANLMTTATGLENDLDDYNAHSMVARKNLKNHEVVFNFGSIARTLNSILIEAAAPLKIDLLSLDVEGAEIEVLKGIDHNRYRFKFICVESRDFQRINTYLTLNGYVFVEQLSIHDFLFKSTN